MAPAPHSSSSWFGGFVGAQRQRRGAAVKYDFEVTIGALAPWVPAQVGTPAAATAAGAVANDEQLSGAPVLVWRRGERHTGKLAHKACELAQQGLVGAMMYTYDAQFKLTATLYKQPGPPHLPGKRLFLRKPLVIAVHESSPASAAVGTAVIDLADLAVDPAQHDNGGVHDEQLVVGCSASRAATTGQPMLSARVRCLGRTGGSTVSPTEWKYEEKRRLAETEAAAEAARLAAKEAAELTAAAAPSASSALERANAANQLMEDSDDDDGLLDDSDDDEVGGGGGGDDDDDDGRQRPRPPAPEPEEMPPGREGDKIISDPPSAAAPQLTTGVFAKLPPVRPKPTPAIDPVEAAILRKKAAEAEAAETRVRELEAELETARDAAAAAAIEKDELETAREASASATERGERLALEVEGLRAELDVANESAQEGVRALRSAAATTVAVAKRASGDPSHIADIVSEAHSTAGEDFAASTHTNPAFLDLDDEEEDGEDGAVELEEDEVDVASPSKLALAISSKVRHIRRVYAAELRSMAQRLVEAEAERGALTEEGRARLVDREVELRDRAEESMAALREEHAAAIQALEEEHKVAIAGLNEEGARLSERATTSETEVERLREELSILRDEKKGSEAADVSEARENTRIAREEAAALRTDVEEKQSRVEELEKMISDRQGEFDEATSRIESLEKDLEELKESKSALDEQHDALVATTSGAASQQATELAEARHEAQLSKRALEEERKRLESVTAELEDAHGRHAAEMLAASESADKASESAEELSRVRNQLEEEQKASAVLRDEMEDLRERATATEAAMKEAAVANGREVEAMHKTVEQISGMNEELMRDLDRQNTRHKAEVANLREEISKSTSGGAGEGGSSEEVDRLRAKGRRLSKRLRETEEKLATTSATATELAVMLQDVAATSAAERAAAATASEAATDAIASGLEMSVAGAEIVSEATNLASTVAAMQVDLGTLQRQDGETHDEKVRQLQRELAAAQAALASMATNGEESTAQLREDILMLEEKSREQVVALEAEVASRDARLRDVEKTLAGAASAATRNMELEEEIASLRAERDAFSRDLEVAQTAANEAAGVHAAALVKLEEELESSRAREGAETAKSAMLGKELAEVQVALGESKRTCSDLEALTSSASAEAASERSRLEDKLSKLRDECEDLRERATATEAAMKEAALANEREVEAMHKSVEQISGMNEELMSDLDRLNTRHKAEIAELQSALSEAQGNASATASETSDELSRVRNQLEESQQAATALRDEMEDLRERATATEAAMKEAAVANEREVEAMHKSVEQISGMNEELMRDLDRQNTRHKSEREEVLQALKKKEEEYEHVQQALKEKEEEHASSEALLRLRLQQADDEAKVAKERVADERKKAVDDAEVVQQRLENELAASREECDALVKRASSAEDALSDARKACEDMESAADAAKAQVDEAKAECARLRARLEEEEGKMASALERAEEAEEKARGSASNVDANTAELEQLRQRVTTTEAAMKEAELAHDHQVEAMQKSVEQISTMNEELMRELESINARHKSELARLQSALSEAQGNASAAASETSDELSRVRNQLEESQQAATALRDEMEDLRERATATEAAMKEAALAHEREVEAMHKSVEQISGMNEELMRDLDRQNTRHKAEVAELQKSTSAASENSDELSRVRNQLEEEQKASAVLRDEMEDLRERATATEAAMKEAAVANGREVEAMHKTVEQISGMNEELMRDLDRQNTRHKAEVAELRLRVSQAEEQGVKKIVEAHGGSR
ncbi:hypothetical protein NFJ02_05g121450 [Pycnococcus provasolii]